MLTTFVEGIDDVEHAKWALEQLEHAKWALKRFWN
jgi:hypothetical protein